MAGAGHREVTPLRSRTGIVVWTVFALLVALAVPSSIAAIYTLSHASSQAVAGTAGPSQWISTHGTARTFRHVPDGDELPPVDAHEALASAILTDLDAFWAATMPRLASKALVPPRGGVTAVDSSAAHGSAPCISQPSQIVGNAFYCPSSDGFVYDSSALVPILLARYGIPGVVATFAHEYGHAIQARVGPTLPGTSVDNTVYPPLVLEEQGDCYAGAFLAWVDAGHAKHIRFDSDAVLQAANSILDFSDPVTTSPSDPTAHGMSVDRLTSLAAGFVSGAAACHAMTRQSTTPALGSVPLPPGGQATLATQRFATVDDVLAAARTSLADSMGAVTAGTATPSPPDLAAATPYGQFAQAASLAYAVGLHQGSDDDGPHASESAACFVGAWTAAVWGRAPVGSLGSWPGDADEALAAIRHRPQATFTELVAFSDGFRGGEAACS